MSRFEIDHGIWENGKMLSWMELCDTLNHLDQLADENLDEYEYIVSLKKENDSLKFKLESVQLLLEKVKDYIDDIESLIE